MSGTTITASTETGLNNAIGPADTAASGNFTIDLTGNITETIDLSGINLHNGVSLTVVRNGNTLNGAGEYRGFFVYGGTVAINNLTITNAAAISGAGRSSDNAAGGGGAGGQAGTYVADPGYGATGGNGGAVTSFSTGGFGGGHSCGASNGNGERKCGGGGADAGGDVFVYKGSSLVIGSGTMSGGAAQGGAGGTGQFQSGTSGTIIGGSSGAILFAATSTANELIVDPGAVFTGGVADGATTLQLASAASAGTLATFSSTSFTNFDALTFDSGSSWTVKGTTSSSGLGTVAITGLTSTDTIDLVNFAPTSAAFADNALTLTTSANAHAALHARACISQPVGGYFGEHP